VSSRQSVLDAQARSMRIYRYIKRGWVSDPRPVERRGSGHPLNFSPLSERIIEFLDGLRDEMMTGDPHHVEHHDAMIRDFVGAIVAEPTCVALVRFRGADGEHRTVPFQSWRGAVRSIERIGQSGRCGVVQVVEVPFLPEEMP
jgi:hypothetical protein